MAPCPCSARLLAGLQPALPLALPPWTQCPVAVLQAPDTWVAVHAVSSAEGGLLDPDDRLADVADDRETLTASFEEAGSEHPGQHTGGDGASGSSVGTGSPDIFHVSRMPNTGSVRGSKY